MIEGDARDGFTWHFGQPWLVQTEPEFAPGHVTISLSENELAIRAELSDAHVTQDVFPFNFPAFMRCDTFEIFLGPSDEKAYYEFHVTPSNSILQLRFDGVEEAKPFEALTVAEPPILQRNIPDPRWLERLCPNPARRTIPNNASRVAFLLRPLRLHARAAQAGDLVHLAACHLQFPPERGMAAGQVGRSS